MKTIDTPAILQVVGTIKRSILRVAVNVGRPLRLISCSRTRLALVALVTALLLLASSVDLDYMHSRGSRVTAFAESISTFASNCSTPATTFNLGDTVCATVSGAPLPGPPIFGSFRQRRFQWVAPNGAVVRYADILTDPQNDSFTIPTDGISAQVGIWSVRTIDNSGSVFALARFAVSNPQAAAVDLSLVASVGAAQSQVAAGTNLSFKIFLTNFGPDDAQSVAITSSVPANTTFVADTQDSGPGFTCTTPSPGSGTGDISCTIATLPVNATAVFTFTFQVNGGTADGTIITGAATASSSTSELQPADNTGSSSATVSGGATGCTLNCSGNILADNDANQCSAIVTYGSPTTSGDCGSPPDNAVICNPPSGSVFPIGVTAVNCSTQTGGVCSFSVTVHDTRTPVQPTITCPSDITVGEEFPDSGSATVNYPAPTTTGNCVTTVCDPPSGSSFNVGTTTVNCTATDSANNIVSCSFTVRVTSGAACTLTCPGDVTQPAASGQCTAVVTYPDPATSGNCGTVTCTPPSGSTFVAGSTAVTCTSSEGPSCSFTVTVVASGTPTITTCASNKTVSTNAACEATIPNLVSEVVATGCNVTVSQAPAAGSIVGPGTITVTITAENSAGEATCTATVNVVDTTAPTITTCPAPTSTTVGSSCQAAVPDVTTGVTAADNCTAADALTISQSPAAGTMVGVGTNTITITVKDASNNSTTCTTSFTVNGPQLTALGNAGFWVGLKNNDDVGTKFDLLAEVLKNGAVVGSGEIDGVPGGSSGFNNAVLDTISLALAGPVGACGGDTLSVRLSVRVAANSGHVSGTARLWFNDAAANSRFNVTVGGASSDYYLLDGFVLGAAAGPGPKKTIDVLVNRNVGGNPFKPFGTWSKTL